MAKKKSNSKKPTRKKKTSKEEVPEFIDIDDKNLRNNFGYPARKPRRPEPVSPRSRKTHEKRDQENNIAKAITIGISIVAILVLVLASLIVINQDNYVEEGSCFVRISTYDAGDEKTGYTELPGTACNYNQDCKDALVRQGFAAEDVEKMHIKCK
jgi:uncharacterized protein YxeA